MYYECIDFTTMCWKMIKYSTLGVACSSEIHLVGTLSGLY